MFPHVLPKRRNGYARLFCLLVAVSQSSALPPLLNADIHSLALASIDYIYDEKYREAEAETEKIIKKYPDHPAGYFFMAVAIDSWMSRYFSDKRDDEFYRYCDLAIEKAEEMVDKDTTEKWALFFWGGAEGYKGTFEFRYERWITAFRHGWKGVSILQKLLDQKCEITDIEYGIGSYEYWRSALMKSMWWMPRVEDKRSRGIEKVLSAQKNGVYTKVCASATLIDIYLNEKKYKEALNIAVDVGQQYPSSNMFMLGKARAFFGLGEFEEADKVFRQILSKAKASLCNDNALVVVCHYWLAKSHLTQRRFAECITECNQMKQYSITDDTKKLLGKYLSEAEAVGKRANDSLVSSKSRQELLTKK
jgi:tetratricopeptide (TPR) repeat protein